MTRITDMHVQALGGCSSHHLQGAGHVMAVAQLVRSVCFLMLVNRGERKRTIRLAPCVRSILTQTRGTQRGSLVTWTQTRWSQPHAGPYTARFFSPALAKPFECEQQNWARPWK